MREEPRKLPVGICYSRSQVRSGLRRCEGFELRGDIELMMNRLESEVAEVYSKMERSC